MGSWASDLVRSPSEGACRAGRMLGIEHYCISK
jgi:hypothetical protein